MIDQLRALDNGNDTYGFVDGADSSNEYSYDANGNMTSDLNKGITDIEYNYLNLPTKVTVAGANSGTIDYVYDATGTKLRKMISTGTETLYSGNFIYEGSVGNAQLQFFYHPEGYATPDGMGGYDYVYQYRDHLGNVRLSYQDIDKDGSVDNSEILQERSYYPFGLEHRGYNGNISAFANSVARKFMFGGKEYQDELGLEWYDVSARNYDPALGRWMNIDPLAEQMYSYSPYNYGFDNPIYFFDEDGNIPLPMIVNYSRVSSQFGLRMHPIHKVYKGHGGMDLVAPTGSNVNAAARGKVVKVGWDAKGYGRYIVIQHADGYYSIYAHLEKSGTMVKVGDNVSNGQLIATSGNTGGSTGPHLHFEIAKAKSLSGVFKKENKVHPESIYDLDQKLHGATNFSYIFEMGFDLFWSVYGGKSGESSDSSSGSEPRTSVNPVNTIDPVGPVITPTPLPTVDPIIPVNPGPPNPTPSPNPLPIVPPKPRPDSGNGF